MGFVQVGPNSLIGPKFLFNVFQVINLVIDISNNSSIIFNNLRFYYGVKSLFLLHRGCFKNINNYYYNT